MSIPQTPRTRPWRQGDEGETVDPARIDAGSKRLAHAPISKPCRCFVCSPCRARQSFLQRCPAGPARAWRTIEGRCRRMREESRRPDSVLRPAPGTSDPLRLPRIASARMPNVEINAAKCYRILGGLPFSSSCTLPPCVTLLDAVVAPRLPE